MAHTRLNPQLSYYLLVENIYDVKYISAGSPYYIHKMTFRDENGEQFGGEFLWPHNTQDFFKAGEKQRFKVVDPQEKGDIIIPLLKSDQTEEKRLIPSQIRPIAGAPEVFALQAAKDVFSSSKGIEEIKFPDDMDTILMMANGFYAWFVEKQEQRLVG